MSGSWSRRRWLQGLCAAGAGAALAISIRARQPEAVPAPQSPPKPPERGLELYNTHTRESAKVVYRRGDEFDPAALDKLDHLLRDHRSGESFDMDVKLYDQLYDLAVEAGVPPHYDIISGYRSPESNAKMAAREGSGVSKKSLHMQGRAIDVRLRNCSTVKLRDLALAAKRGGVGYYEKSDFVHIDTGAFRTWVG